MADELNTNGALDDPAKADAQPVNATAQPEEKKQESDPKSTPVNLYDLPEFKNYQRNMDRQMTDLRRQAGQLAQRADQAAMANMDDFQKAQFERDQYANQVIELTPAGGKQPTRPTTL